MTRLSIMGWSAVTSAGVGSDAVRQAVVAADRLSAAAGVDVTSMYAEPLPSANGHALTTFDVRSRLGRKGTSSFDRATALAVVCCHDALHAAGLGDLTSHRTRVGVALGTSLGSFKSTSDFSRETLVQERPYLVNPLLFPNTVMNCAAGQAAIRFGLRGVNATIAGGTLAFLNAVRYANNILDRGYADVMLVGAVEEYTPHRAWAWHLTGRPEAVAVGEAAAVFVLSREQGPSWVGDEPVGAIRSVATAYGPGGEQATRRALAGCVARALKQARADAADVSVVLTGELYESDAREYEAVLETLPHKPRRVLSKRFFGESDAASGGVSLAVFLAATEQAGSVLGRGGLGLITGCGADGAVGAAIVEGRGDGS